MVDPDDDPVEDALCALATGHSGYALWLDRLRGAIRRSAEASALCRPDMSEWHSAVYLLSGNDAVWDELDVLVMEERSIGPMVEEFERPRRPWASTEDAVLRWAADFWDVDRWPAKFPYVFERFLFDRWVTERHLRQCVLPALTVTEAW